MTMSRPPSILAEGLARHVDAGGRSAPLAAPRLEAAVEHPHVGEAHGAHRGQRQGREPPVRIAENYRSALGRHQLGQPELEEPARQIGGPEDVPALVRGALAQVEDGVRARARHQRGELGPRHGFAAVGVA
jgi:hypothetical protein